MDSLSVGCGSALSRFVYDFVRSRVKVSYSEVIFECRKCGFERDSVEHVIDFLLVSGKFFEPKSGVLEFVDYYHRQYAEHQARQNCERGSVPSNHNQWRQYS